MVADQRHRHSAIRAIRAIPIWIACLIVVVLAGILTIWMLLSYPLIESRADRFAYRELRIGMEIAEAEKIFGRQPEYSCHFKSHTVYYFLDRSQQYEENVASLADKERFPDRVESKEDLPDVYAAIQFLVDDDGSIIAYTMISEELHIHTTLGDYDGARLAELPNEFLESLSESGE